MPIVKEDIDKVRNDTDIAALVGEYTSLKRSGKNMMGLCVFHDEKSPSMSVSPDEGFYHCFGCGESGDAITFVRKKLGLEFSDAMEMLAGRLGYTLNYTSKSDVKTQTNRKRQKEVFEQAMLWYHEQLMNSESGGPARAYLKSRGYDKVIVEKWKLGWAPAGPDNLSKALNCKPQELKEAELASVNEQGAYDFFRSRILFPIFNQSGQPVGFGGRIMPNMDGPKYINSRDSAIYQKRYELYGLNRASQHIVSGDRTVVVEGYTDVIGMEDVGILECVATCGTSLTQDHLRKLSRLSKTVVLVFDPDSAGSSAMGRSDEAVMALEELDIEIKVAKLPGNEDPGDLAQNNPEVLHKALDESVPLLEFKLLELFNQLALETNEEKYRASQQAGKLIANFFSRATKRSTSQLKEHYVNLVSERTQVSAEAISADMKADVRSSTNGSPSTPSNALKSGNLTERQVLLWVIHRPEEIPDYITSNFFQFETEKNLFDGLLEYDSLQEVRDNLSEESARLLTELNASDPPTDKVEAHIARLIFAMAERIHDEMNRELQNLITQDADAKEIEEKYRKMEPLKEKMDQVVQNRLKLEEGDHPAKDLLLWLNEELLI